MDDAVNKIALHLHAFFVVFGGEILLLVALTTMLCPVILVQVNDELIAQVGYGCFHSLVVALLWFPLAKIQPLPLVGTKGSRKTRRLSFYYVIGFSNNLGMPYRWCARSDRWYASV